MIGDFSSGDLSGWKEQRFKGKTTYTFVQVDGKHALMAKSAGSASGLYKFVDIDLNKTPYLNWSWRITNTLQGLDELTKSGDDYPARIYVIFRQRMGIFRHNRLLNYVWSSNQPINSSWQSAYSRHSMVIAVQSKTANRGQWVTHKRNIRSDYRQSFGEDTAFATGIALMTDTDNSGQSAISYYGNIFLSKQ
tara:strand:+ start:955 stop:1530 length:576 start_codon:yes stop_codon:yes gene_type:complete